LEVLPPLQSPSLHRTMVEVTSGEDQPRNLNPPQLNQLNLRGHPSLVVVVTSGQHTSLNPPLRNATHHLVVLLPPRAKHPRDLVAMAPLYPHPVPLALLEVPLALLEVPLALLEVLPVVLVE